MSHVPSTLATEHADRYSAFAPQVGEVVTSLHVINLFAEEAPAPNQSIAIPVDGLAHCLGPVKLYTHLDVWSLPAGTYVVGRLSVIGDVSVRLVTAYETEVK